MQTNAAAEQNKSVTLNGQRVRRISPISDDKVCGRKDMSKSQIIRRW